MHTECTQSHPLPAECGVSSFACCFELEADLWPWGWPSGAFDLLLHALATWPYNNCGRWLLWSSTPRPCVCPFTSVARTSTSFSFELWSSWFLECLPTAHLIELCPTPASLAHSSSNFQGQEYFLPTLFLCFLLICYPYISLRFLFLFISLLFSSRCMLELKFDIYHTAASPSSQASSEDVCSIGWRMIDQAGSLQICLAHQLYS